MWAHALARILLTAPDVCMGSWGCMGSAPWVHPTMGYARAYRGISASRTSVDDGVAGGDDELPFV